MGSCKLKAFHLKDIPLKVFPFNIIFNSKSPENKLLRGLFGQNQHLELHLEISQKPGHFSKCER